MREFDVIRRCVKLATVAAACAAVAPASALAIGGIGQLPAPSGCLKADNSDGTCGPFRRADDPRSVVVSPDGRNVYVANRGASTIAVLDRDSATGALTQKPGRAGCVAYQGGSDCAPEQGTAQGLLNPGALAISPDGRNLYAAGYSQHAVVVLDRNPDTGELAQKPGAAGCLSPTAAGCTTARALNNPLKLAVAPDGHHVYVTANDGGTPAGSTVAVLTRADDGTLSQADGPTGCVSDGATAGCTADAPALAFTYDVAVSPDNAYVYVSTVGDHSVVAFARDGASGGLTPVDPGAGGCVTPAAKDGCTVQAGMSTLYSLTVDARRVYATSFGTDRVLVFDRQANGGLAPAGCVANGGSSTCAAGRALDGPSALALSGDGASLYVASLETDSVTAFDSGAALTPKPGGFGCLVAVALADCATGTALDSATGTIQGIAVSPDGHNVYATATGADAVVVLKRDTAPPACTDATAEVPLGTSRILTLPCSDGDGDALTRSILSPPTGGALGAIDQATGQVSFVPTPGFKGETTFTFAASAVGADSAPATFTVDVVCVKRKEVRGNGIDEDCDGKDLPAIVNVRYSVGWDPPTKRGVRIKRLVILKPPAGLGIDVRCRGRGCPFKKKTRTIKRAGRGGNLVKLLRGRRLGVKAVLELRLAQSGKITKVVQIKVRKARNPKLRELCLPPNAKRPERCD